MNQVVIVGRVVSRTTKNGCLTLKMTNESSEYPIEIRFTGQSLINSINTNISDNDLIGIKGEVRANNRRNYILGTKVTFLTNSNRGA
mgnify:FL=1